MTDNELTKSDLSESDLSDSGQLLAIIESQLSTLVTISEMDGALYDELMDDRIKTMSGAFRLIREAQRKLLADVKKFGEG